MRTTSRTDLILRTDRRGGPPHGSASTAYRGGQPHRFAPTASRGAAAAAPGDAVAATRRLLACGVVAGPLYVGVAAAQVVTREGFDISRHAVSLLSNGALGWVQIANFGITGLLTVAAAVGLHRMVGASRSGRWAARLLGLYGASLVAAGAFVADPALGFPPGTPDGAPVAMSGQGLAHLAAGGVGFLALVLACLLLARRFTRLGRRGWAIYSRATGVLFLAAFAGIASGGGVPLLNIAFTVAVVLAWTWISLVSARAARIRQAAAR